MFPFQLVRISTLELIPAPRLQRPAVLLLAEEQTLL